MASKNLMIGTGAALAGLGGLAAAAVTIDTSEPAPAAQPVAKVETRTVVIRTVEHRVKRVKARHVRPTHAVAVPAATPAPEAARVVQAAPIRVAAAPPTTANSTPIRTRASGGSGSGRGDDRAEHESGGRSGDDAAEHADD